VADDFEEAFNPVFDFAGFGIDECDLIDGAVEVYEGAGGGGNFLIWGATVGVEHSGSGECAGIELAHGALGVI
jgi:hypothetical protein